MTATDTKTTEKDRAQAKAEELQPPESWVRGYRQGFREWAGREPTEEELRAAWSAPTKETS